MRTGAWEDLAEATRRAVTNPDPGTMQTLADPGGLNSQLASWFRQLSEAPRLSATGPVPCSPPKPVAPKEAPSPKKR
jgi:hypothetical protein